MCYQYQCAGSDNVTAFLTGAVYLVTVPQAVSCKQTQTHVDSTHRVPEGLCQMLVKPPLTTDGCLLYKSFGSHFTENTL